MELSDFSSPDPSLSALSRVFFRHVLPLYLPMLFDELRTTAANLNGIDSAWTLSLLQIYREYFPSSVALSVIVPAEVKGIEFGPDLPFQLCYEGENGCLTLRG